MEFIMEHIDIIIFIVPVILIMWVIHDYIKILKCDYKNKDTLILSIKVRLLIAVIIFIIPTAMPTHNSDSKSSNKAKTEKIETEEVKKEDESLEEEEELQVDETEETIKEDESLEEEEQQIVETPQEQQVVETPPEQQVVVTPPGQQVVVTPPGQQVGGTPQETAQNTNIHKNSINGIEYKLLNQADPQWKDIKYTTRSGTIGEIGCMITTVAVVSSAYDKTMTPKKVMDAGYQHNYPSDSIPYFSSKNFTCTRSTSPDKNAIINNLKQGNPVVIMVKAASAFTTSQHYMALIDIKSDGSQVFVGNAYGSGTGTYNRSGWFDTNTVLYDMREVYICIPSQSLINQY